MAETKKIVWQFLGAMADGDAAVIADLLTEDVVWWVPPAAAARGLPRPLRGREDVTLLASGQWSKAFQAGSTRWDEIHMIAEGDLVSSLMHRIAIGANGKPYDNEYNWAFRFEGDLIAEVWEVMDTAWAFELLGGAGPLPRPDSASASG